MTAVPKSAPPPDGQASGPPKTHSGRHQSLVRWLFVLGLAVVMFGVVLYEKHLGYDMTQWAWAMGGYMTMLGVVVLILGIVAAVRSLLQRVGWLEPVMQAGRAVNEIIAGLIKGILWLAFAAVVLVVFLAVAGSLPTSVAIIIGALIIASAIGASRRGR